MDKSKVRHDFINNGLRIEVLNRLITDSLEKKENLNSEYLEDLDKALKAQISLVLALKELDF